MGLTQSVALENLTFGQLYRFVDHARTSGISDDELVAVDSEDNLGNEVGAHTLTVDLGDVDQLARPVLIDGVEAREYAQALYNDLQQNSDKSDREILGRLLDDLWGLPQSTPGADAGAE